MPENTPNQVPDDQSVVYAISQRLLTDTSLGVYLSQPLFFALANPASKARWEARRHEREAEWDTKTAEGLIGLEDHGDYECGPEWVEGRRGEFIEKWTTPKAYAKYQAAVEALEKAANAL